MERDRNSDRVSWQFRGLITQGGNVTNVRARTRQGQPIGFNLTYGQVPAPLIGVSLYDNRIQTVRAVTVRGCQSRASAASRGNFTEHPQDRQNTRLTAVHREVRPSRAPLARSPRRVRARRRGQFAFKMRFRIANPWINRSRVNCDQVSFWFQKQKRPPFKSIISR